MMSSVAKRPNRQANIRFKIDEAKESLCLAFDRIKANSSFGHSQTADRPDVDQSRAFEAWQRVSHLHICLGPIWQRWLAERGWAFLRGITFKKLP